MQARPQRTGGVVRTASAGLGDGVGGPADEAAGRPRVPAERAAGGRSQALGGRGAGSGARRARRARRHGALAGGGHRGAHQAEVRHPVNDGTVPALAASDVVPARLAAARAFVGRYQAAVAVSREDCEGPARKAVGGDSAPRRSACGTRGHGEIRAGTEEDAPAGAAKPPLRLLLSGRSGLLGSWRGGQPRCGQGVHRIHERTSGRGRRDGGVAGICKRLGVSRCFSCRRPITRAPVTCAIRWEYVPASRGKLSVFPCRRGQDGLGIAAGNARLDRFAHSPSMGRDVAVGRWLPSAPRADPDVRANASGSSLGSGGAPQGAVSARSAVTRGIRFRARPVRFPSSLPSGPVLRSSDSAAASQPPCSPLSSLL